MAKSGIRVKIQVTVGFLVALSVGMFVFGFVVAVLLGAGR